MRLYWVDPIENRVVVSTKHTTPNFIRASVLIYANSLEDAVRKACKFYDTKTLKHIFYGSRA